MRIVPVAERRWPCIRSAPTKPLSARTPAFPAMRRPERGSALLLETVAKSSSVSALGRRCASLWLLSGVGRTYIRSAPTEPLPARIPAFPAMRRAERGSGLLLETVAKSSSVQEMGRRCAYSRFLSGTAGGVGHTRRSAAYQAARRAQWARGRSRVRWLKNQRVDADCHRANHAVRRMARRALFCAP